MSGVGRIRSNEVIRDHCLDSYCIILRDVRPSQARALVEVKEMGVLTQGSDDGIVFEEFVKRARAYLAENPLDSFVGHDIYIGFYGQWSCEIPQSFFAFVVETGLQVQFDIND